MALMLPQCSKFVFIFLQPFDSSAVMLLILSVIVLSFQEVSLFSLLQSHQVEGGFLWLALIVPFIAKTIVRHLVHPYTGTVAVSATNDPNSYLVWLAS